MNRSGMGTAKDFEMDGRKFQFSNNIYEQEEENLIIEFVTNIFHNNSSIATSELVAYNRRTGMSVDFGALLPKGPSLIPANLYFAEDGFDEEKGDIVFRKRMLDLSEYKGVTEGDDLFSAHANKEGEGYVLYGDITKTGGLLTLLYEISHTWRSVYGLSYDKGNFEKFYKDIIAKFAALGKVDMEYKKGILSENIYVAREEYLLESLEEMGMDIISNNIDINSTTPPPGEVYMKLQNPYNSENIITSVGTEKIYPLVVDYEQEERDAWAHGIRVLKFLRQRDIDVEPGLNV